MKNTRNIFNNARLLQKPIEMESLSVTSSSNQFIKKSSSNANININIATPSATRTYTIPNVGANANFVLTGGTIASDLIPTADDLYDIGSSAKRWQDGFMSGVLTLSKTSNQIVLGKTSTMTISSTAPSTSRTITLGDPGGTSVFIRNINSDNKSISFRNN